MITLEREKQFSPQEKIGSDAFRTENLYNIPPAAIVADVNSYLGEYRFKLSKYPYDLKFRAGKLMDPITEESMVDVSQKAIDLKRREGRSSIREQAEKIGFENLNKQLIHAQTDDTIIWMSPPGPKEEGYGEYGFVYFGKVDPSASSGQVENIKMTAMRIEDPTVEQFQKARHMLTGKKTGFKSAEQFLEDPTVVYEDLKEGYVDAILKRVFGFVPNKEEQEKFQRIIEKMGPLIKDFAINPFRKREDIFVLENYAIELKKENYIYERFSPSKITDLGVVYRNEPPKVAGSCGSTSSSSLESNNIFNSLSSLNGLLSEDKYGSRTFECPSCKKTNIRPKDKLIENCQHCGRDVKC